MLRDDRRRPRPVGAPRHEHGAPGLPVHGVPLAVRRAVRPRRRLDEPSSPRATLITASAETPAPPAISGPPPSGTHSSNGTSSSRSSQPRASWSTSCTPSSGRTELSVRSGTVSAAALVVRSIVASFAGLRIDPGCSGPVPGHKSGKTEAAVTQRDSSGLVPRCRIGVHQRALTPTGGGRNLGSPSTRRHGGSRARIASRRTVPQPRCRRQPGCLVHGAFRQVGPLPGPSHARRAGRRRRLGRGHRRLPVLARLEQRLGHGDDQVRAVPDRLRPDAARPRAGRRARVPAAAGRRVLAEHGPGRARASRRRRSPPTPRAGSTPRSRRSARTWPRSPRCCRTAAPSGSTTWCSRTRSAARTRGARCRWCCPSWPRTTTTPAGCRGDDAAGRRSWPRSGAGCPTSTAREVGRDDPGDARAELEDFGRRPHRRPAGRGRPARPDPTAGRAAVVHDVADEGPRRRGRLGRRRRPARRPARRRGRPAGPPGGALVRRQGLPVRAVPPEAPPAPGVVGAAARSPPSPTSASPTASPGTDRAGGYAAAPSRSVQPVLSTFSSHDVPLTRLFHLAARRRDDLAEVRIAADEPDRYAALGGVGPRHAPRCRTEQVKDVGDGYDLGADAPASVYGVDASRTVWGTATSATPRPTGRCSTWCARRDRAAGAAGRPETRGSTDVRVRLQLLTDAGTGGATAWSADVPAGGAGAADVDEGRAGDDAGSACPRR